MTYQFCPGANATTDFNVLRNTRYNVTLSFKAGSLFSPSWKVDVDAGSWNDTRTFSLINHDNGAVAVPNGDGETVLAMRPWMTDQVYSVYFNRNGVLDASRNEYSRLRVYDNAFDPVNVADNAYSYEVDNSALQACGVEMSAIDAATGEFSLTVTDDVAYQAHIGQSVPLTLTVYPGGVSKTIQIRICQDIAIDFEDETWPYEYEDMYVCMARTMKPVGFVGSNLSVFLDWDTSSTETFLVDAGDGRKDLTYSRMPITSSDRKVILYTADVLESYSIIYIGSDDYFNDGEPLSVNVRSLRPEAYGAQGLYVLPVDGTPIAADICYRDRDGEKIPKERFDPILYNAHMTPKLKVRVSTSAIASAIKILEAAQSQGQGQTGAYAAADSVYLKYTHELSQTLEDSTHMFNPGVIPGSDTIGVFGRTAYLGDLYLVPKDSIMFDYRTTTMLTTKNPELMAFSGVPTEGAGAGTQYIHRRQGAEIKMWGCKVRNTEHPVSIWQNSPSVYYENVSGSDGFQDGMDYRTFVTVSASAEQVKADKAYVYWEYAVDETTAVNAFYDSGHGASGIILPYGERKIALTFINRWSLMDVSSNYSSLLESQPFTLKLVPVSMPYYGKAVVALRSDLDAWTYRVWVNKGLVTAANDPGRDPNDDPNAIQIPGAGRFASASHMLNVTQPNPDVVPESDRLNYISLEERQTRAIVRVTPEQALNGSNDPEFRWPGTGAGTGTWWDPNNVFLRYTIPVSIQREDVIVLQ